MDDMEELKEVLAALEDGVSKLSRKRPESMEGVPVGIPYPEYEGYYDQIVSSEDACVYVAVHKLNDAILECWDLISDCEK